MAGLLDRALSAQKSGANPAQAAADVDIPAVERRELLEEIEQVVEKARVPLASRPLAIPSRLADVLLPILTNAGALVIICIAALATPVVLGGRVQQSASGPGSGLAGEAALVGTLKRESEEALRQIQSNLQTALKERDELAAGAEERIRRRQQELAASLNAELAAERQRLRSEGASTADVERRLQALEQRRRAEAERQLSDFQRQVDAELARKDAEISSLRAQSAGGRSMGQRMAVLQARTQAERLVLDQLTASYARVGDAMKAGKWEDARAGLDSLGSYLDEPAVAGLPAVQGRRTLDLFLIDSLRRLAQAQGAGPASGEADDAAEARAQATARAVAKAITAGNALYAAGNYRGSLERYGAALQALKKNGPGVETLDSRIAEAGFRQGMADLAARQDRAAKAIYDRAEALAASGAWADAVASYAALISTYPQSDYVARSTAGILTAVDELDKKAQEETSAAVQAGQAAGAAQRQEQLRAAVRERLQALRESLSDAARKSTASADAAQEELIALLQVKVDVRQVLLSDSVRAEHPDLAARLDRFIDLTAEVRRAEGRAAAMRDAATVIESLTGGKGQSDPLSVLKKYSDEQERSSVQKLLDALRGIF